MKRVISIICVISAILVVGSAALQAAQDQHSLQVNQKTL